jgi:hypothetical protein
MHWLCAIVTVTLSVGGVAIIWRWRTRGRAPTGATVLYAVGLVAAAVFAWWGAHTWIPGAVDTVRSVTGFKFIHDIETQVYEAMDQRRDAGASVGTIDLRWEHPTECLNEDSRLAFMVARAALDPVRPDVETSFIAMDMTRLRLHIMQGGTVPAGAVAAFNGAFQTEHGRFGLRSSDQTQIPARLGAATIAVRANGSTRLFAWGTDDHESDWVGLRQNLDLLLDASRSPPVLEELTLIADGARQSIGRAPIRRSGLCTKDRDTIVYVWSKRATARTLGDAMVAAGCAQGMLLDANTFHTRFEYLGRDCVWLGAPEMTDGPPGRFLSSQTRDFFSVTLHPVAK